MRQKKGFGFIATIAANLVRVVLALRYRVTVKGLKEVEDHFKDKKGILFLPNHTAEVDPLIVLTTLWHTFRPRPLVVDYFYYMKGAQFFMDCAGALPLPNLTGAINRYKLKQLNELLDNIAVEMKEGANFLIYPSGRLKLSGREVVGRASFVHNLLQECPDVGVVLVRIRGLWGSRFSRALTGEVPSFGKKLLEGIKIVLQNFLFFVPKREVSLEFSIAPPDFSKIKSRLEMNTYLEDWFNRYPFPGPEPIKLVSEYFWKQKFPPITAEEKPRELRKISPEMEKEIFTYLAKLSNKTVEEIKKDQHLTIDLGLDSLDIGQIHVFLDVHYDIADLPPSQLQTVEDVLQAATGFRKEEAAPPQESKKDLNAWLGEKRRLKPALPEGDTLQEAFFASVRRMKGSIACADAVTGVLSYRRLKLAALTLAERIKKLPGSDIGILMPSSVAAYLLILATLMAKKVPVMMNWTVGARALDHAVKMTGLQKVISSRRFLERLENGELGSVEDKLIFLEDIRDSLTWKERLSGLLGYFSSSSRYTQGIDPHSPAVILFTSGTESLPKGVPLSHYNLLSNQRAALSIIDLQAEEIMFGVLPPFHSFGFSVTGLLPILAGMKVCFSPDPTNSHAMAYDIAHWKPTLFCSAPTFIKAVFQVAKPQMLESLRLVVSGAEKTPEELFAYVARLDKGKVMIEGYGITECGPIVTLCRPDRPRRGVGQPLPGIELMIIDPTTMAPLPLGEEGEICIAGPNVFSGYLGDLKSPFYEHGGVRWYRSGDRGHLESDGSLVLSGRLKRFVKIGGEMISLGGLEEELMRLAQENSWQKDKNIALGLAIGVKERDSDRPELVLFTTFEVSKDEVNAALKESGWGRNTKIGEIRHLNEIPLTGTGKIHYRLLDELLS